MSYSSITNYILSKTLARGGMAEIYLGKVVGSDGFQKICAIKRILPHYAQDPEFVNMFRTEAHVCKGLHHANIVQVFDFKEVNGSYAIIMEYVDGVDLRTILAACELAHVKLSVPMILYIGAQVAKGLYYAHTKTDDITGKPLDIIHRDISPQNILISFEGEVKLIDFGIANFESKMNDTRPGVVKGKYSYMSPEQVLAKPLDFRTDIFSLSIVLWEALAMRRLFAAPTEVETIRNVQSCIIPYDLKILNKDVDDELQNIILKGLHPNKKQRYSSANLLEKELTKYLQHKYPDFTTNDLSKFLKQLLADKRNKMQEDIKQLLSSQSSTEQKELFWGFSQHSTNQGSLALKLEVTKDLKPIAISRSALRKVGSQQAIQPLIINKKLATIKNIKKVKNKNSVLLNMIMYILVIVTILTSIGLIFYDKIKPFIYNSMNVSFSTEPAKVSITIDDNLKLGYMTSPHYLSIPAGQHTITIMAPGYITYKANIEGKKGTTLHLNKISLTTDFSFKTVPLNITVLPTQNVMINMDNGYFIGNAPVKLNDFFYGQHTIVIYPNYPAKYGAFKCSFTLQEHKLINSYILNINLMQTPSQCIITENR